jgi:hypothetical protein
VLRGNRPPSPESEASRVGPWFCRSAILVQLLSSLTWPALHLGGSALGAARPLAAALGLAGVAALGGGARLHLQLGHDRRTKYNALLGGQALLSWSLLLTLLPSPADVGWLPTVVLSGALSLLPQSWLLHRLVRPEVMAAADLEGWRRALRWYRSSMRAGTSPGLRSATALFLSRLLDPTGYCFLLLRYSVTEKLLRSKVVYLRAFREPPSDALARSVVAPACQLVPIEAWLHDRPSEQALRDEAKRGLRARHVRIDDADWQLWLEHELKQSLAVIVDASAEGANLSYELKLALQLVPRERIVVLLPEGMREPRSGLASITYDAGTPEQAARPLHLWLERVIDAWRGA